jgi:hypothetical protein
MNGLAKLIGRITGWDRNPGSVFYIVAPLAVIAFGLKIVQAVMLHDKVMIIMSCAAPVVLVVAAWPGIKTMRQLKRLKAEKGQE